MLLVLSRLQKRTIRTLKSTSQNERYAWNVRTSNWVNIIIEQRNSVAKLTSVGRKFLDWSFSINLPASNTLWTSVQGNNSMKAGSDELGAQLPFDNSSICRRRCFNSSSWAEIFVNIRLNHSAMWWQCLSHAQSPEMTWYSLYERYYKLKYYKLTQKYYLTPSYGSMQRH